MEKEKKIKEMTNQFVNEIVKDTAQEQKQAEINQTGKVEKTYERTDIEDTPFSAIKEYPKGTIRIATGNYMISEKEFKNMEQVMEYLKLKPWELLINVMALISDNIYKLNNQKPQEND